MGATLGVVFRGSGGLATKGTSFQLPTSLALGGGGAVVGVAFLGGGHHTRAAADHKASVARSLLLEVACIPALPGRKAQWFEAHMGPAAAVRTC